MFLKLKGNKSKIEAPKKIQLSYGAQNFFGSFAVFSLFLVGRAL